MSSSSSTMRMSDAITDLFSFSFVFVAAFAAWRRGNDRRRRQDYRDHRAPAAVEIWRRVVQFEPAAMVLHDLLDDSEAKAGAFFARRHVGLEQPLPILARKPFAIVDNVDSYGAILAPSLNPDCAVGTVFRIKSVNGLGGVLDDVAKGLRHQAAVEGALERLVAEIALEGNVGAADFHQERRLAQRFAQIDDFHLWLRHAGEGRELVDHAADVLDLADDGIGALIEDLAVLGDDLAVTAPDALGRKLDRRQRILDLMRNAPRDICPGRRALRLDEIGDVVDSNDIGF